jgi:hypothetical protein
LKFTAVTAVVATLVLGFFAAAGTAASREFLTVDFEAGQVLRYRFVSSRQIDVEWKPAGAAEKGQQGQVDSSTESMEMVVAYEPVSVDPYGLTTVRATCEQVAVKRSKTRARAVKKDAVEFLPDKSFTVAVAPNGSIEDYSGLDELVKWVGEKAFRPGSGRGRIKEPDMIGDFVATQWFLWDSVSSIDNPAEGVSVGRSWKSKILVPAPMVMRKARDVTYTFEGIEQTDSGPAAVITSRSSLSQTVPEDWPVPYTGRFQMSGTFGFLRGYKVLGIDGEGRELFDVNAGRTRRCEHDYTMEVDAGLPAPLGVQPRITIRQKITMELL